RGRRPVPRQRREALADAVAGPRRFGLILLWAAALAAGLLLRIAPLPAARPYIAYVDEGNFLHPVVRLLREGGWDPHWYEYPQLPIVTVTGALRVYAPVYRVRHGRELVQALLPSVEQYDDLEPFVILKIARAINAAIGVAVVILAGLLARRLAGPLAGGVPAPGPPRPSARR